VEIKQFFLGLIACVAIQGWATDLPSTRIINGTDMVPSTDGGDFYVALMKEHSWGGGGSSTRAELVSGLWRYLSW